MVSNLDPDNTYSYHIEKNFGGYYLAVWPYSGFGQYCTKESDALKQYEIEAKDGPCRVVRYKAVIINGKVIGCTQGTQQIIKESLST